MPANRGRPFGVGFFFVKRGHLIAANVCGQAQSEDKENDNAEEDG
jgi:hypothetical protein